ncbi:hypothetical protein OKW42_001008 [Paraburkholderia sp. WC7.3d]
MLLAVSIEALTLSVFSTSVALPRSTNSLPGTTDKAQHDNTLTAINANSGGGRLRNIQSAKLPGVFGLRAEMSAVRDKKNDLRYLRLLPSQTVALIARLDSRTSQIGGHAERYQNQRTSCRSFLTATLRVTELSTGVLALPRTGHQFSPQTVNYWQKRLTATPCGDDMQRSDSLAATAGPADRDRSRSLVPVRTAALEKSGRLLWVDQRQSRAAAPSQWMSLAWF